MASPARGNQGQWTRERINLEWERQLERIRELRPHAALIVGLADGPAGPTPLQEASQLLINAAQELKRYQNGSAPVNATQNDAGVRQLPVLYAGAPQYIEPVRRMLVGHAEVTRIESLVSQKHLGPASRPTTALYQRDLMQHIPCHKSIPPCSLSPPF